MHYVLMGLLFAAFTNPVTADAKTALQIPIFSVASSERDSPLSQTVVSRLNSFEQRNFVALRRYLVEVRHAAGLPRQSEIRLQVRQAPFENQGIRLSFPAGMLVFSDGYERTLPDYLAEPDWFFRKVAALSLELSFAEMRGEWLGDTFHRRSQERGFEQGLALACLAELVRRQPTLVRRGERIWEKDAGLYFWEPGQEGKATAGPGLNTAQGILGDAVTNARILSAWFQRVPNAWQKTMKLVATKKPRTLLLFEKHWLQQYPEDSGLVTGVLAQGLRNASLACLGDDLWIGIPQDGYAVNVNGATPGELTEALSLLSNRLPLGSRQAWIHFTRARQGETFFEDLSQALVDERGRRCGQFRTIQEASHFVTSFSDEKELPRKPLMDMLKVIVEAKVEVDYYFHKREVAQ